MPETEFYLTLARGAITAFVYFALSKVVQERRVSKDAELAKRSFGLWWLLLGLVTVTGMVGQLLSQQGLWTLATYEVYLEVVLLTIIVALAALMYYFVYLFTGRRSIWKLVALVHVAMYLVLEYFIKLQNAVGIKQTAAGVEAVYANDLSNSGFAAFIGIAILLPVILGALGYFSLIFKVDDRSGKFRIATVAGAFLVWFGSSILAGQAFDVATEPWWEWVSAAIVLLASYAVYIAFRPPAWVQKWLRVTGYVSPPDDGESGDGADDADGIE